MAFGIACHLVENRQGIAHAAIGLAGNDAQGLFLVIVAFLLGHVLEMAHDVGHLHAVEVVDLATAEDGWQNLVLLRGGQDEDGVGGRLFKGLEEGIEGCR